MADEEKGGGDKGGDEKDKDGKKVEPKQTCCDKFSECML